LTVQQIDNVSDKIWNNALIEAGETATIFQSLNWAKFLEKTYGDHPIFLASFDKKGDIQGLLLAIESCYSKHPSLTMCGAKGIVVGNIFKKFVSPIFHKIFPFIYWENGPVIKKNNNNVNIIYYNILRKVIELAYSKNCYEIKFARPSYFSDQNALYSLLNFNKYRMGTVLTDLSQPLDDLWMGFKKDVRKIIRKTIKKGVYIEKINKKKDLKDFYNMHLGMSMRKKIKVYPYSHFLSLWNHFSSSNNLDVFVAKKNDIILGSLMFLKYNKMMHIYAGGDSNYARLNKIDVNYYLNWYCIEWAKLNGLKYFDHSGVELYKVEKGNKNAIGILNFKTKWGNLITYNDYNLGIYKRNVIKYLNCFIKDTVLHS